MLLFSPHDWQKSSSCWSDISNNVAKTSKKNCLAHPTLQGWFFHPVSVFYADSHSGEYYLVAEGHSEKQGVQEKYQEAVHICLCPWDRNPKQRADQNRVFPCQAMCICSSTSRDLAHPRPLISNRNIHSLPYFPLNFI